MKITEAEQMAIQVVVDAGTKHGFGNMIAHLQTAWALRVMREYKTFDKESARSAAGGDGYPFGMHEDLILRGEWDETGKKYRLS